MKHRSKKKQVKKIQSPRSHDRTPNPDGTVVSLDFKLIDTSCFLPGTFCPWNTATNHVYGVTTEILD